MASRKHIYLTDSAETVLGNPASLSGRLNSIVTRYGRIISAECPALSENEWMLICDMLNGTGLDADHRETDPARYLWADIAEAGKLDGLANKWGVDTDAMSARVRAMRPSEQIAIVEVAARFWTSPRLNQAGNLDLLREAGARIA